MADLSPTTQRIWQKFCGVVEDHGPARLGLAAALRAVADELAPLSTSPGQNEIRTKLLGVVVELEVSDG